MKIRKGDNVIILAGKDRGVEGKVVNAFPNRGKVVVQGANIARRHKKATSQEDQGGIVDKEMPMDVSNVAVVSPKDGKATRVGYRMNGDTKERYCKRTEVAIPEAK